MASILQRVLEPEVMDTLEEAHDYDAMDHTAVNARFCADLLAQAPLGPTVLDVGTGTALIPIGLCQRSPSLHIVGIDLAVHMLDVGSKNVAEAGFADRITLAKADAKAMPYANDSFDSAVSNSIIHHIPEPIAVLAEMIRVTRPGGLVFVRDLVRPADEAAIEQLTSTYEAPADPGERPSFERQLALFRASLGAALTLEEVDAIVTRAGGPPDSVRMTSDRHWTLTFRKS